MSKLKSSLFVCALVALPLWAKPVAQVTTVTGSVFAISPEGKTLALKPDSLIEEKSELMLEEDASITLNDYYDATYHLIGGTHLKFFDKSVQLKRGKVWVQSGTNRAPLALTTANGSADFWKSEFIATFDQATSRSQILVVNGEVEVSNVLDKNMKYTVAAGNFSLIDPEVENGVPRAPTKVGLDSLNKALAEFKAIPEQMKAPERSIASVKAEDKTEATPGTPAAPEVKKGEITFITTNRLPASVEGGAHKYFTKKVAKKKSMSSSDSMAPIRFFGTSWKQAVPEVAMTAPVEMKKAVEAPRAPASVQPMVVAAPAVQKASDDLGKDEEFSLSLKRQATEQPKHTKELESLINDLKSY